MIFGIIQISNRIFGLHETIWIQMKRTERCFVYVFSSVYFFFHFKTLFSFFSFRFLIFDYHNFIAKNSNRAQRDQCLFTREGKNIRISTFHKLVPRTECLLLSPPYNQARNCISVLSRSQSKLFFLSFGNYLQGVGRKEIACLINCLI